MDLKQSLRESTNTLASGGIDDAYLEAEILLRHVLGWNQAELQIHLREALSTEQSQVLESLIQRRLSNEPTAYITGHKEFFGLEFYVNYNTLIPRPETELLVGLALDIARDFPSSIIADIGTGCGAIAVAIAVNLPQARVYATDVSAPALETVAWNAQRHVVTSRIHLLQGSLLEPLPESVDLIVANLPYVSDTEMENLSDDIRLFEPGLALSGGPDGLGHITRLLYQSIDRLHPKGAILLEISPEQRTTVAEIAIRCFPTATIKTIPDLSGSDRVVIIKIKA